MSSKEDMMDSVIMLFKLYIEMHEICSLYVNKQLKFKKLLNLKVMMTNKRNESKIYVDKIVEDRTRYKMTESRSVGVGRGERRINKGTLGGNEYFFIAVGDS